MYKYDLHIHTNSGSACATATGKEQAINYKKAGYTGIVITEHFFNGNSTVPKNLPWEDRINLFTKGYEEAKEIGDQIGLQVFFGWEETFIGQDFLIYGLDKNWLLKHPEVQHWTIEEQFEIVNKEGGIVIQAHPYRDRYYIPEIRVFPDYINGVEVYNACNEKSENDHAFDFAKEYNLPMTAGSDSHHPQIICSGIEVPEKFNSIMDYVNGIKNKTNYKIIY